MDRYWAAHGPGSSGYFPLIIVDSGHQWTSTSASGTDYYNVYKGMVDTALSRAPKAEVIAQYTRVGNHFQVQVRVTNRSGAALSTSNGATVVVVVYEDVHAGVTSRYGRAVVQQSINTALANDASRTFTLETDDLTGVSWSKLHIIAMVDYLPGGSSGAYDMLQAAVATPGAPLSISPATMMFLIDHASPMDKTMALDITGGDPGLAWQVTGKPAWVTVTPASAEVGTPASVKALAGSIAPGYQSGAITIHFSGAGTPFDRSISVTAYRGALWPLWLPGVSR